MGGELAAAAAALLGERAERWQAVAGGDLSRVVRVHLSSGGEVVAKTGPAPKAEARMLAAMSAAGVPVPGVLAVSDAVLVLVALDEDGRGLSDHGWADLGAALRRLHRATGDGFGWPEDYAFGPVPIDNARAGEWPVFWAERRLLPFLAALPPTLARRVEALAAGLSDRLPARPQASLLHGDMWSGNLVAAGGRLVGLIDPACYHGHGEVDLAMLHLFGTPGPGFAAGYGSLEPGAADRRPVYQLWPALVHARLFGDGYLGLVHRLLDDARA